MNSGKRALVSDECLWAIVETSPDGILIEDDRKILFVNQAYAQMLGYDRPEELIGKPLEVVIQPEDVERLLEFSKRRLRGKDSPSKYEFKGRRKDGSAIHVEASVCKSTTGDKVLITTILRDISERKQTELLITAQKKSLEMVVLGSPVGEILKVLANAVELQTNEQSVASIFLLDKYGCLRNGASPSLPEYYINAIDGIKADPAVGTCAAAAALGEVIITPDIDNDAGWQNFKHLPLELGLLSAWSVPIMAKAGHVLGTFGTYFREKRGPTPMERQIVQIFAHTAALAIERHETEIALNRYHATLESQVVKRTRQLAEVSENLEKGVEERLRIEEERVGLLRRIVTTQEEERRRIARDMHDHFGQQITALRLKLETIKTRFADHTEFCIQIEEMQGIARTLDSDMGFLVWELRPAALDDLGLQEALGNYVSRWSKRFQIAADFYCENVEGRFLNHDMETHFYRLAQEALNNINKHAFADQVSVVLECRNDQISLIIEDDGIGFDLEEKIGNKQGFGLIGMRERALLSGGKMKLESIKGAGTTIYVRIPVKQEEGVYNGT